MAAPTPIASPAADRYTSTSNLLMVWATTMANYNTPTSAEISAGTDFTIGGWIGKTGITGFDVTAATAATDDLYSGYDWQLADGQSISGSPQIAFKRSKTKKTGSPEKVFSYGLAGYVVLCDAATWATTGAVCDVWPVTVSAVSKSWSGEALFTVSFQPSAPPALRIPVPTA